MLRKKAQIQKEILPIFSIYSNDSEDVNPALSFSKEQNQQHCSLNEW